MFDENGWSMNGYITFFVMGELILPLASLQDICGTYDQDTTS